MGIWLSKLESQEIRVIFNDSFFLGKKMNNIPFFYLFFKKIHIKHIKIKIGV